MVFLFYSAVPYAHRFYLQNAWSSLPSKQGRDGRFCYLASNAKMDAFTTLQAVHSRSTLRFLRNTLPGNFRKKLVGNESQTQKNALRAATRFYKTLI